MQLSEHFTLEEFTRSSDATKFGIDNTPGPEHLANLRETAAVFEKIRALLGDRPIRITSGYRSPALNKKVKGTATSAHPQGLAGDFHHPDFTPLECARRIRASSLQFDQVILETSRGVVHVGIGPGKRRKVGEQKGPAGTTIIWKLPGD